MVILLVCIATVCCLIHNKLLAPVFTFIALFSTNSNFDFFSTWKYILGEEKKDMKKQIP